MNKNKQIPVLLGFLGVLFAIAMFFIVYKPYIKKAEIIETENLILMQSLNKYKEIAENEVFYKESTDKMNIATNKIISEYATGLIREDQIMYMTNMQNRFRSDFDLKFFNMDSNQEIIYGMGDATQEIPDETPIEESTLNFQEPQAIDNEVKMYKNTIESSYEVTYEGLKDVLDYVNEVGVKKNITDISLSFDSTSGLLAGSMSLSQYYLTGTDGIYSSTNIPSTQMGVENIFGTIDVNLEAEESNTEE